MTRLTSATTFSIAVLVALAVATTGSGQEKKAAVGANRQIVRWVTMLNNSEIQLSSTALKNAQSEQVQQFARKMIRDHERLNEQLKAQLAGKRDQVEEQTNVDDEASFEAVLKKAEETARTAVEFARKEIDERVSKDGGSLPVLDAMQQIEQQTLDAKRDILAQRKGLEFDKAFMVEQASSHLKAVQTLEVLAKYATGDLQQTLQQAKTTAEGHLQEAREIFNALERK